MLNYIYYASIFVFCSTVSLALYLTAGISLSNNDFLYEVSVFNSLNNELDKKYTVNNSLQIELFENAKIQNDAVTIFLIPSGKVVFSLEKDGISLSQFSRGFLYVETFKDFSFNNELNNIVIPSNSRVIIDMSGILIALTDVKLGDITIKEQEVFNFETLTVENLSAKVINDQNFVKMTKFLNMMNINLNFKLDTIPPNIFVLNDSFLTDDDVYEIFGKVDEEVELTINSKPVFLSEGLFFSHKVTLRPGQNEFNIEAIDNAGNKTEVSFEVTFKPKPVSYPVSYSLTSN
ncbi:MAG: hypothetical protein KatS3mg085_612 [Candidatus Dojkabacteria bacterium]|nr:MAG: hypothetical protein KatS3mg085_612 [Candidatus Dojkabacteria bacterium]